MFLLIKNFRLGGCVLNSYFIKYDEWGNRNINSERVQLVIQSLLKTHARNEIFIDLSEMIFKSYEQVLCRTLPNYTALWHFGSYVSPWCRTALAIRWG